MPEPGIDATQLLKSLHINFKIEVGGVGGSSLRFNEQRLGADLSPLIGVFVEGKIFCVASYSKCRKSHASNSSIV